MTYQSAIHNPTDTTQEITGNGFRFPPMSTAQRAVVATMLGAGDAGMIVRDVTVGSLFTWNGTAFVPGADAIPVGSGGVNGGASTTNVIVGTSAGIGLTTGTQNVAVGSSSLFTSTTGSNNVVVGFSALSGPTLPQNMVAVGFLALSSATSAATGCTGLGRDAGRVNGAGIQNTLLGFQAGTSANGSNNTFVGVFAGALSTGSRNTLVGASSGGGATLSGSDNTCIGKDSGLVLAVGAGNTLVGETSGIALSGGSGNTLVGQSAATILASGSSNIAIGRGVALSNVDSNYLAIGSVANWVATNGGATTWFNTATAGAVVIGNAQGYIRVVVNGTPVKIPVFGN